MYEITRKNFNEECSNVIDNLRKASFISIDCEFSGLFDESNRCSLFDSPNERYRKLENGLKNFSIIQVGISTFEYNRFENSFVVSSYSFYLLPSYIFKSESNVVFQSGSLDFLCQCNFDYNKLFYEGISYLSKCEEAEALRMVEDETLIDHLDQIKVQKYFSEVLEWSEKASIGDEKVLILENETETFVLILHQEIRKRFLNLWTYVVVGDEINLKKVSPEEKKNFLSNKDESILLKNKILHSLLGFSIIVKEIENLKKPLVGHNCLLDLMMIYKQFYNSSHVSYKKFKREITTIFPQVFDTKHISFCFREILTRENTWNSNSLPDLYHYFKNGKGATLVIFTPHLNHTIENFEKSENFHDAGFDSYCTGLCFIKMAHAYSLWDAKKKTFTLTTFSPTSSWLLKAVASMKNHLNISRGQLNHIVLDGPDPKSERPGLLFIESRTKHAIDVSKVEETIAKYGLVDIQLLTKYTGLMAVSNERQLKDILGSFKNHKQYKIAKYNFLRHSRARKTILVSIALVSTIFISFLISKKSVK